MWQKWTQDYYLRILLLEFKFFKLMEQNWVEQKFDFIFNTIRI